jgi:hypothetical protein
VFTDNNDSEKYEVILILSMRLFSPYLRTEGQTHKQKNETEICWFESRHTESAEVIAAVVNYFSEVLQPKWFGAPESCLAGLPLSSALNSGDVSQGQGHPTVRHTQIGSRMICNGMMDHLVLLLIN